MGEFYPSTEMQLVYSTASANWATMCEVDSLFFSELLLISLNGSITLSPYYHLSCLCSKHPKRVEKNLVSFIEVHSTSQLGIAWVISPDHSHDHLDGQSSLDDGNEGWLKAS